MPTGLWEKSDNDETKFAYYLNEYSNIPGGIIKFQLFLGALEEPLAVEELKNVGHKKSTLLELALDQLAQCISAKQDKYFQENLITLIEKMVEVCPALKTTKGHYEIPPLYVAIEITQNNSIRNEIAERLILALVSEDSINQEESDYRTALVFALNCLPTDDYDIDEDSNSEVGDKDNEHENEEFKIQCTVVKILLNKGANPNLPFLLSNKDYPEPVEITPLLYSARYLHYKLFKILSQKADSNALSFDKTSDISDRASADINALSPDEISADSNNDSNKLDILDCIFARKNTMERRDFIYLLLRHPQFDLQKNAEAILGCAHVDDDIKLFIEQKINEHDVIHSSQDSKIHWIKSFNSFYYGTHSTNKIDLITDGDQVHLMLKAFQQNAQEKLARDSVGNVASAVLTFVVSHSSDLVTHHNIPIGENYYNYVLKFMNDEAYVQHIRNELAEYSGKIFPINNYEKYRIFENAENFNVTFKHSEQALFLYLRQNINQILNNLIEELKILGFDENFPTFKIKAIILNIFSERYMCHHCQAMALAFQKPSAFIEPLTKKALELGFLKNRKSKVKFTIMVSANTPYVIRANKQPVETFRFTEDEHSQIEIDLKALPEKFIFFKDTSKSTVPMTAFFVSSSKNIRDQQRLLEAENIKLRAESKTAGVKLIAANEEIRKLKKANADLMPSCFGNKQMDNIELEQSRNNNQPLNSSTATTLPSSNPKGDSTHISNNKKRKRGEDQPAHDAEMRAPEPKLPNSETNIRFVDTASNNNSFSAAAASAAEAPNETTPDQMDYDDADQTGNLEQSYKSLSPS